MATNDQQLKRRPWTKNEDDMLLKIVEQQDENSICWNIVSIGMATFTSRSSNSCRERYQYILKPSMTGHNQSDIEEDVLFQLHRQLGNNWMAISSRMPGRNPSELKNRYYTTVRRTLRRIYSAMGIKKNSQMVGRLSSVQLTQWIQKSKDNYQIITNLRHLKKQQIKSIINNGQSGISGILIELEALSKSVCQKSKHLPTNQIEQLNKIHQDQKILEQIQKKTRIFNLIDNQSPTSPATQSLRNIDTEIFDINDYFVSWES